MKEIRLAFPGVKIVPAEGEDSVEAVDRQVGWQRIDGGRPTARG